MNDTVNAVVPVLDAREAAAWDERARLECGVPGRVLMEAAGRGIAWTAAREFAGALGAGDAPGTRGGRGGRVLVAAGAGNNGGDAWVAARALARAGLTVTVATTQSKSEDCIANRELARLAGIEILGPEDPWPAADLVIDGLLGTGATGEPRGETATLANAVAHCGAPVLAVDGPTGLDLTTGEAHGPVRADVTCTFGGVRRGHLIAREWCGRVAVIDIGFPPPDPAWPRLITDLVAEAHLPPFWPAMHKGDRGKVLIIGGDSGMAGAVIHAARGAFAAGTGLVKIAAHQASVAAAQAALPDALTVASDLGPGVEESVEEALEWADAVVIGPGLGRGKLRDDFVHDVLKGMKCPVLIDADALHLVEPGSSMSGTAILTPHHGEFRSLFPDLEQFLTSDRFRAAADAARASAATVLLKGVPTIVADPSGPLNVVAAGNPGLATGGSGDVLAGLIAAFLARGLPCPDSALLGAVALGRAAEICAEEMPVRSIRPRDVIRAVPTLWRRWAELRPPAAPLLAVLEPPAVV